MEWKEGRNVSIDILKGAAAYLVVLGHCVTGKEEYCRLYNFIYAFHMPLFMFLAGYTAVASYRNSAGKWNYLARRFVNIMVPYLFWTVSLTVINSGSFHSVDWQELMIEMFISNKIYWFLPTLFGLLIGYVGYCGVRTWILSGIRTRKEQYELGEGIMTAIDALSCILITGIFILLMCLTGFQICRDIVGFTIPFFAAVMYMEHNWIHTLFHHRASAIAAILFFCLLIGRFDFDRASVATSILRMILGMCAVVILLQLAERLHIPGWMRGLLVFYGRSSLIIYLLQSRILKYSELFKARSFGVAGDLVWYGIVSLLVCGVCSVFCAGMSRIPIVSTLLLGKTRNRCKKPAPTFLAEREGWKDA